MELLQYMLEDQYRDVAKHKSSYDLVEFGYAGNIVAEGENIDDLTYLLRKESDYRKVLLDEDLQLRLFLDAGSEFKRYGVFHEREISNDNIFMVLKEYCKMRIQYYQVLQERVKGNFKEEREARNAPSIAIPVNFAEPTSSEKIIEQKISATPNLSHDEKPSILLSTFIEDFVAMKIDDEAWQSHMINEHRSRLNCLTKIIGDVTIQSIDDTVARDFRRKLRALPPNWSSIQEKQGLAIDELVLMKHAKTLASKTIKTTIQAISSLFLWGVQKGKIKVNPFHKLNVKDTTNQFTYTNLRKNM